MPDKLKPEAKELLRQFDELTGDSLNAVKAYTGQETGGESKEAKEGKEGKKKKFWK